ncbi:DUF892 family protein [Mucilaginibacter psychrotolerans]|nr:DUF892 family protein [Mucilaginibacter psychrotolerans]
MQVTPIPTNQALLEELFTHHLNRIYSGKCFLDKNLEHLISLASSKGLQLAIEEIGGDVKKQILRMQEIYQLIGKIPDKDECNPIKSIVKDEFCLDEQQTLAALNDLDLMLYVQVLEHVNITSYRMLIMIAKLLHYDEVTQLLKENFDESEDNDKLFMLIAKEYISE